MTGSPVKGRKRAAWTLVALAPICAEMTFGALPLSMIWVLPLLVPMYGAGVLLIREAVRRAGGGWPSLLVLALVYELAEDGIGLQALTSPTLYQAAEWGPRVLGLNTAYWESQIGYHAVFSVMIPIMLTDLIHPAHRDRPYLRRGGLIGVGAVAVLGVAMLRLFIPPTVDPGYQAPLPALAAFALACVVLSVIALKVLPGRTPPPPAGTRAPKPVVVGLMGAFATVVFLGLLIPIIPPPAGGRGWWALGPMALAAALAVVAGLLLHRWSASGWTDAHRIWLAGGALVGHTLFGSAVMATTTFDRVGLIVLAVVTALLLALLGRRVANRLVPLG
ncbi:hypothetical protein FE391_33195 [Nonomuraea sp. KC401]|uniref:hypothetical protein n=1 Tax=unclassified Nonomuraea TaxID=2593643 RepID=UPI0010FE0380|nr:MULTISPECIES: hypothetical protein [unclassified Nonomuraea]NBE98583.1 hypothetical protein [Nonomuraea sp. K271]TLF60549.1 hypothetical protein FE391_33195 [Nonomuraea sp. KC401]